jgi:zinc protease
MILSRDQRGRIMKWDEQLEHRIQALTPQEINAAFRRHVDPAALAIVEAGDFR